MWILWEIRTHLKLTHKNYRVVLFTSTLVMIRVNYVRLNMAADDAQSPELGIRN